MSGKTPSVADFWAYGGDFAGLVWSAYLVAAWGPLTAILRHYRRCYG